MSLSLPPDYSFLFRDRVCIITGVGRSGTTIMGKLIGSMSPTAYLFEPLMLRLMPPLVRRAEEDDRRILSRLTQSILFEDYIAPVLAGRSTNCNVDDDSYYGNYFTRLELEQRWSDSGRRQKLVDGLSRHPATFVMKIPEFQPHFETATQIFPGVKFVQITRNGLDVVASATERGWYSDAYLRSSFLDWMTADNRDLPVPTFIEPQYQESFRGWSPTTRAAAVWRRLTESGIRYAQKHPERCRLIDYRTLTSEARNISAELATWLGLIETDLTRRHLESIADFAQSRSGITIGDIEEPERQHFVSLMERLHYL